MVQGGAMNEVALFCSSNATARPQALSRRNTLHGRAVASRPLSGMTSCLAPSPAVMSSPATTATRSEPLMRNIFLVFPSGHERAEERAWGCPAVGASTFLILHSVEETAKLMRWPAAFQCGDVVFQRFLPAFGSIKAPVPRVISCFSTCL